VISARVREPGSRETTASGALAAQGLYGVVSRSVLVRALQQGIRGHDLGTFVDEPPTIAQGGRGVVVTGCPMCRTRFQTTSQFVDHLAYDVLPEVIASLNEP
jgi:hypothetical protein